MAMRMRLGRIYTEPGLNAPECRHSSPCRGATMVEHRVHIAGVIGSSPIQTTKSVSVETDFSFYVMAHLPCDSLPGERS